MVLMVGFLLSVSSTVIVLMVGFLLLVSSNAFDGWFPSVGFI